MLRYSLKLAFAAAGLLCTALPRVGLAQEAATNPEQAGLMVLDYEFKDPVRGFKMQVPSDWNVKENVNGYALFMEPKIKEMATPENPIVADPNISVAVLNQPVAIDEQSLEDYAKQIETKFKATNGEGIDFTIFSKHVMELPEGRKGLLYYLSYKNNGVDVGSMILVMSNATHLFRTTYTDYKLSYEKNFERIFPVLASIQVQGPAYERPSQMGFLIPMIVTLVILTLAYHLFRRSQAKKMQQLYSQVGRARKNKSSSKRKAVNSPNSQHPDMDDDLADMRD